MRFRLPLFILAALALFLPLRASAAVVSICNNGSATLNVARAIYSKSFFFGNSYHISGWYEVAPRKCEVIYSEDDPEALYLGFMYHDAKNNLRAYVSEPETEADLTKAVSERFCVGVAGEPFDYKTRTKGDTSCQDGFASLEFSIYMGLDEGNYGRVSYTAGTSRNDMRGAVLRGPSAAAKMMFGGEVQLVGKAWTLPNGTAIPANLINPKTDLPPLGPKQQYSIARPPVAGYVKQIVDVLTGFRSCHENDYNADTLISSQAFVMDGRGVLLSAFTGTSSYGVEHDKEGVAIAGLDLDATAPIDRGDCWEIQSPCKGGGFCAQSGEFPGGAARNVWSLYLNSRDQANSVLSSLKAIAPYYPDAAPEIHQVQ